MGNPKALTTQTPLSTAYCADRGLELAELPIATLVALSIPRRGLEPLRRALGAGYSLPLPEVGRFCLSDDAQACVFGLACDQLFLFIPASRPLPATIDPRSEIKSRLGATAYLIDQSHAWTQLRLSGAGARAALALVCPLDLDAHVFPLGACAYTAMEHVRVLIAHWALDDYRLFAPTSFAQSFWQILKDALRHRPQGDF